MPPMTVLLSLVVAYVEIQLWYSILCIPTHYRPNKTNCLCRLLEHSFKG